MGDARGTPSTGRPLGIAVVASVSFIYPATSPTRYTLSSLPLDCKSKLSSAASWGLVDEVLE
ncbi:hypothetical protein C8Q76DRAFT_714460 [Earliella scabrosa]|nr:hypothetical protein C8Q76DRAFT_714419 [Earliella scabrosa]KAI0736072.1 hypothetical protein C8Q76DRAFT_714460 [Earliella scabrosa]